jgi:hypothetical protein
MEVDENFGTDFKVFEAAPAEHRSAPERKRTPDYFL